MGYFRVYVRVRLLRGGGHRHLLQKATPPKKRIPLVTMSLQWKGQLWVLVHGHSRAPSFGDSSPHTVVRSGGIVGEGWGTVWWILFIHVLWWRADGVRTAACALRCSPAPSYRTDLIPSPTSCPTNLLPTGRGRIAEVRAEFRVH